MATTTIYLIRHAHAEWRDDDARSLSSSGREAASVVADQLGSQPIVAIYSSPSRRSIETVLPFAKLLGLEPELVPDLRERELPIVAPDEFFGLVLEAWRSPGEAPRGGESNDRAQARGLAVVRRVASLHAGRQVALATHGNLLALVLNAFDPAYGYEFWQGLSFPDVYRLELEDNRLIGVDRCWDAASPNTWTETS